MEMGLRINVVLVLCLAMNCASAKLQLVKKRAVSTSLADVLGLKTTSSAKNKPVKITPPLRLKPGETAERPPGWQHCIKNVKAGLTWRNVKSPGYPDFLQSQIQCSWIVEAPIGMRVKLAFRDLDMIGVTGSCAKQFVQIIDIGTGKSQGRFCGTTRPGDYVSLGTKARIDIQADKAITKARGFLLSFAAVNEIPGFRSTKSFQATGRAGSAGPGKVNVQAFKSNSKQTTPKPSTNRRPNRRLVYESDRSQRATDSTVSDSANSVDSGSDESGWIGDSAQSGSGVQSGGGNANRRRNPPAKVTPTSRRVANGPTVYPRSARPVRIRASPSTTEPSKKDTEDDEPKVIYGKDNQPHNPNHYTTIHPVRIESGGLVDHRENELSTTSLMIIIACAVLFFVILVGIGVFLWFVRRRRNKKRNKKKEAEKMKKAEEDEKRKRMELNVARLFDESEVEGRDLESRSQMVRPDYLPGYPHRNPPGAPPYPDREFTCPRSDARRPEFVMRSDSVERGVRIVSKNGVSFRRDRSEINDTTHGGSARNLNTVNGNGFRGTPTMPRKFSRPVDNYDMDGTPYINGRNTFHQLDQGGLIDYGHPDRRRSYSGEDNLAVKADPHSDPPIVRFHTLDPTLVDNPRASIHHNELSRTKRNTLPGPRRVQTRGLNYAYDDVDEDYCSGSDSGKAPMRREYSPWELEQQKSARKKKLINGR